MISWDNVFVEAGRGVNDLNHGTQTKWIDPETGEVHYSNAQTDSKTGLDFREGILWSTAGGGAVRDWSTQRNLFIKDNCHGAASSVTTMSAPWECSTVPNEALVANSLTIVKTGRSAPLIVMATVISWNTTVHTTVPRSLVPTIVSSCLTFGCVGLDDKRRKILQASVKWVDMLKVRYSIGEVGDDNLGIRFLYATQWAYGGKSFHGLNNRTESPLHLVQGSYGR